jgi:dynactin complex subunit
MAHQQLRNKAQSETHCQTATSTVDAASYQSEQLERKRSIDRRAQREHRKRQKLRVEELVAQNELLKRGGDEKVQALITENERLQNQVRCSREQSRFLFFSPR